MPDSHAISRRPAPEELELAYRRRILANLRSALAERESRMARLRNQLNAFEGRYIRQVGVLYIQLDEWHDRLAELNNPTSPTKDLSSRPESAPFADAAERPASEPSDATLPKPSTLNPKPYLKSLFREVAKRIHPDHARDRDDEQHRTQLMAQANAALLREDAALLHRMLHSHDLPMEATDARTELARTVALIRHLQQDLIALNCEMEALTRSEMADLQRRTAEAAAQGSDLLAELAARVKGQIGIAMSRYERELARRRSKQPSFDPAPLLSAETPNTR
jgi:hypothetical protein